MLICLRLSCSPDEARLAIDLARDDHVNIYATMVTWSVNDAPPVNERSVDQRRRLTLQDQNPCNSAQMSTTQILFNSPALHSLKRDQLVKLCKIHSLKASGKKIELIQRLKFHAKTLPPDDPLSIATWSENPDARPVTDSEDEASDHSQEGNASMAINNTRPSEQWEVVMETITEVDEETLRSNRGGSDRQVGEFGTTTSKGQSRTQHR